jgi:hypothetical protein
MKDINSLSSRQRILLLVTPILILPTFHDHIILNSSLSSIFPRRHCSNFPVPNDAGVGMNVLVKVLIGGPVGKFSSIPPPPPTTHKIGQQKKPEKRDQSRADHSPISTKPHFNALLLPHFNALLPPAPFLMEFDPFCKKNVNSGNITV